MLEKLKQYKELIAIIAFFIGGFIWMEAQFPKKADLQSEIATLDCMLEKYMTLTQLQIQGQELQSRLQDLDKQVNAMLADVRKPTLSPSLTALVGEMKKELDDKKHKLLENKGSITKICDELQRNACKRKVLP